jgi:Ca2+-dependent lipid-binding protein
MGFVEFTSAANLPAADLNGKSDPYVIAKVAHVLNAQKVKTKVISNNLNPVWNEQKTFLLGSGPPDSISILVYDRDVGSDDDKIATGDVPFRDIDFSGTTEWQERELPLKHAGGKAKGSGPPTLKVKIKITCDNAGGVAPAKGLLQAPAPVQAPPEPVAEPPSEPVAEPPQEATQVVVQERSITIEEGEFSFSWGNFTSSYSTSLSGYTNYPNGSLSALRDEEDGQHRHPPVEPDRSTPVKPSGPLVLTGTVIGARGIPKADSDGTDSYVIVNLGNKGGKEKKKVTSEIKHDTSDPDWNVPFDLGEVRKGQFVEFTVFQHHQIFAEQPLGYAKYEVKDIEPDKSDPIEIQLEKPEKFKKPKWEFTSHGTFSVVFNLSVKPT